MKLTKNDLKSALIALAIYTATYQTGTVLLNTFLKENREQNRIEKELDTTKNTSLDDICNLLKQKDAHLLSKEAKQAINEICSHQSSKTYDKYNKIYLDLLDINEETATKAYANFSDIKIDFHMNTECYNEEKKEIDWETLITKIYKNSKNVERENPTLKALSKEEIEEKLQKMKKFVENIKKDYPNFDLASLACKLEGYSILKAQEEKTENVLTIASTSSYKIIYYDVEKYNYTKKFLDGTDYHEDFHLFVNSCIDKRIMIDQSKTGGGIGIETSILLDDEEIDSAYYTRYQYVFLEEIYAELYSSEMANKNQDTYICYDEILDLIQLVLALSDEYQVDSILTDLIYQDPISFMKHFPIYGEDRKKYFIDNLIMLKSLDTILLENPCYLFDLEKKGLNQKEAFTTLKVEAMSQLSKTFFNSLITMTDTHFTQMSLEDNYFIIDLFTDYLNQANGAMMINTLVNGYEIDFTLNSTFSEDLSVFFDYLSKKYKVEKDDLMEQWETDQPQQKEWKSFMPASKQEFYQELIEQKKRVFDEPHTMTLQKKQSTNVHNLLTTRKK